MTNLTTRTGLGRSLFATAIAAAAALALSPGFTTQAEASSLPAVDADYSGTYLAQNAFPGHGLWLPNFYEGATKKWSVQSGTVTYDSDAGTLDLNGIVRNNGLTDLEFEFDFSLNELAVQPDQDPYCGNYSACKNASQDMKDNVKYFDFAVASLTGIGGAITGLVLDLEIMPADGSKPPQFGYGANWYDAAFGYSNWFFWDVVAEGQNPEGDYNLSGRGDMNLSLAVMPLPAGAWLMIAGLASLGALRRKARKVA